MSIDLVTKFAPHVDEQFSAESKLSLLTNKDYNWTGAHSIKIYKVSTAPMNDYDRNGENRPGECSRFGPVKDLSATTEELLLKKDRSFTFAIDKLDQDETGNQVAAASALARQIRQEVIPEVDEYTYSVMAENAGTKAEAIELTADNIYDEIAKANEALDDAFVPETERFLVVTPAVHTMLKKSPDVSMETNVGNEMKLKGVVGEVDGLRVIKIPAIRLPENFGFMIAHPVATVAPVKLEDYRTHIDPPGISGSLVEGRICYDAFVLENKAKGIYYQPITA